MTKLELASALSNRVDGLPLSKAIAATEGLISIITESLVRDHSITIRGFATIKPVVRSPRKARNISQGNVIDVPARRTVKFIPSKELKNQLNNA